MTLHSNSRGWGRLSDPSLQAKGPRAGGGPALTLHWAAVGTGVKKCLGGLVTIPPPQIITFNSSLGSLAP